MLNARMLDLEIANMQVLDDEYWKDFQRLFIWLLVLEGLFLVPNGPKIAFWVLI